jgi:hypothetical protein
MLAVRFAAVLLLGMAAVPEALGLVLSFLDLRRTLGVVDVDLRLPALGPPGTARVAAVLRVFRLGHLFVHLGLATLPMMVVVDLLGAVMLDMMLRRPTVRVVVVMDFLAVVVFDMVLRGTAMGMMVVMNLLRLMVLDVMFGAPAVGMMLALFLRRLTALLVVMVVDFLRAVMLDVMFRHLATSSNWAGQKRPSLAIERIVRLKVVKWKRRLRQADRVFPLEHG